MDTLLHQPDMDTVLLQPDILCEIVQYLGFIERVYCALTCRTWRNIILTCSRPRCWRFHNIDSFRAQLKQFVLLNSEFVDVDDINSFIHYVYVAGLVKDAHWRPVFSRCLTLTCKFNNLRWDDLHIHDFGSPPDYRYWVDVLELPASRRRSEYFLLITKPYYREPNDIDTDWDDWVLRYIETKICPVYLRSSFSFRRQTSHFVNCIATSLGRYELIEFPTRKTTNAIRKLFISRNVTGLLKKDYSRLVAYANQQSALRDPSRPARLQVLC